MQLHAEVCAALSEPKRIMIIYELASGPRHVTELAAALGTPQPVISRHLKVLRERGVVDRRTPGEHGGLQPGRRARRAGVGSAARLHGCHADRSGPGGLHASRAGRRRPSTQGARHEVPGGSRRRHGRHDGRQPPAPAAGQRRVADHDRRPERDALLPAGFPVHPVRHVLARTMWSSPSATSSPPASS